MIIDSKEKYFDSKQKNIELKMKKNLIRKDPPIENSPLLSRIKNNFHQVIT